MTDNLSEVMADHRPDGGMDGPGAMCVTCTPGFGTPAEDPVPYPCVPLGRALLAARKIPSPAEEAVKRVEALIDVAADRIRASTPPLTAERLIAEGTAPTVAVADIRAALASPAPAPQPQDGMPEDWIDADWTYYS